MQEYIGILGVLVLLGISYMLSNNKSLVNKNIIFWGLGLQFSFAVIILKTSFGTVSYTHLRAHET